MWSIFEFSQVKEIVESWLIYVNKFLWISNHVSWQRQWNKVIARYVFLLFRTLIREKKISLKSVIVITVIISMYYKETIIKLVYL